MVKIFDTKYTRINCRYFLQSIDLSTFSLLQMHVLSDLNVGANEDIFVNVLRLL